MTLRTSAVLWDPVASSATVMPEPLVTETFVVDGRRYRAGWFDPYRRRA